MKIAVFAPGVVPATHYGGTERVVEWLVQDLVQRGHEVYFYGPRGCHVPETVQAFLYDFPAGDINFHPVDIRPDLPPDIDIVHVHCASSLNYGFPTVRTVHGYPFSWDGTFHYGQRTDFDQTYSFVSNSHRCVSGRHENPYVHNGIRLSEYRFCDRKDDYLLFLGKVDWAVKGLGIALRVARETGRPLVIAGDFLNPEFYERELKPQLTDTIRYIGPVGGEEKKELLARAAGLIFPVMWPEPFGLVMVEAMASGTPVVASGFGAIPEIVTHGVTGFLCGPLLGTEDIAADMIQAVSRLETIDPAECRLDVERRFSAELMASRYEALYERTIREFRAGDDAAPSLQRNPENVDLWLDEIDRRLGYGNVDAALATASRLVKAHPHYYQGFAYVYQLLVARGDMRRADETFDALKRWQQEISETVADIERHRTR